MNTTLSDIVESFAQHMSNPVVVRMRQEEPEAFERWMNKQTQYRVLNDVSPRLFDLIAHGHVTAEDEMLQTMLSTMKDIKSGKISKLKGDHKVQRILIDKYVVPVAGEPQLPHEQLDQ